MVAHAKTASREIASNRQDSIKTEVGEIPFDWGVVTTSDVGKFRGGNGFPLRYQGKKAAPYPYFKVSDMSLEGNERCLRTANNYIDEIDRQKLGAYVFPENSIVIAKVGAAIFLERKKLLAQPSCLDNNMAGYWITNPIAHYSFIHYYLQSIQLGNLVSATALPSLNGAVLGSIKLPLPPTIQEQEAIAEALSDTDALIDSLEALIAKKRAIKQGAMQDLLSGRKRLPGFSGEWAPQKLGELGPWVGGGTPSMQRSDFWTNGTVPWASSADVRLGSVSADLRRISEKAVAENSTRLVPAGSVVLVTRSGILRRFLPVCCLSEPIAINQDLKALIPRTQAVGRFVAQCLLRHNSSILASCMKTGTTVESIEITWLKKFEIMVPPTDNEMDAVSVVLAEVDDEIGSLEAKLNKARQIKQGMMQELLTGRVRLV